MKLAKVKMICRRQLTADGEEILVFFGVCGEIPPEIIGDDDYLSIGEIIFQTARQYKEYKIAPNASPNQMMLKGGFDSDNYEQRIH